MPDVRLGCGRIATLAAVTRAGLPSTKRKASTFNDHVAPVAVVAHAVDDAHLAHRVERPRDHRLCHVESRGEPPHGVRRRHEVDMQQDCHLPHGQVGFSRFHLLQRNLVPEAERLRGGEFDGQRRLRKNRFETVPFSAKGRARASATRREG